MVHQYLPLACLAASRPFARPPLISLVSAGVGSGARVRAWERGAREGHGNVELERAAGNDIQLTVCVCVCRSDE